MMDADGNLSDTLLTASFTSAIDRSRMPRGWNILLARGYS
jgi:hypothetical protein